MNEPLFGYAVPSMEDFSRYKEIGSQIMDVFNKNNVDEQIALRVLELTTAITLDRVGDYSGLNAINFVEPFSVNVRSYLIQLQSKQQ